ncbi:MAG: NAD(P)/FAD-dependent oxidoreductase [Gammaproteobacteria bacterium]|nr:NAD(P)/FAD-dependent oxidoreductase [Gammaproteobacteria bacterium]MXY55353.1 NAD(P)/FAD-dependent oxidoreductase [Gammaproteobacteria bacterium]MYF29370.1 NAD(P)/FAD-dependent oxidoreductase [Gammaproteobacteria bacterium]MYK48234.1 NAD(P)/FAD-dependent oxidoreductase [Gammaproteobacteria bacterium]
MADTRDLIVVGAGFAGLACAKRAAERGLSVLVIDRQPSPGRYVHTTGILVKEAHAEWSVPAPLVRRLDRVRVYSPSHRHVDLRRSGYYFLATDTPKLMEFLADATRRAGAEIRFRSEFSGVTANRRHVVLDGHGVAGRFLVGADGVHSKVAQASGLDRNTRLLKGVEWEYEPLEDTGDCLHCFVDPRLAPGYIAWVVPGVGVTQVGLAVNECHKADIGGFVEHLDARFRLRGRHVIDKRGGMIPINGLLRRFHRDRILLVGDAAGMVSPLTAGGIHRSYRFGKLAGDAIADYLGGDAPNPGDVVALAYKGDTWKQSARWCFDRAPLAACMDLALGTGGLFKRFAGKVFFDRFTAG